MKKVGLFGCGSGLTLYLDLCSSEELADIEVIFDNGSNLSMSHDIPVARPDSVLEYDLQRIVITSRHYIEIHKQLMVLGVPADKIDTFYGVVGQLN